MILSSHAAALQDCRRDCVMPTEARSGAKGGKARRREEGGGKGRETRLHVHTRYCALPARHTRTRARTHTRHTSSSNLRPRKRLFTPFLSRRWGASFGPDFARGASGKRPLCNLISLPSPALHFDRSIQIRRHFPSLLPFKRVHIRPPRVSKDAFLPRVSEIYRVHRVSGIFFPPIFLHTRQGGLSR